MNRVFWLLALAAAATAASAFADCGIPYVGDIDHSSVEASVVVIPDGSGTALTEAWREGGEPVDASIRVLLVDADWAPVASFPAEDLWLQFGPDPGTLLGCTNHPSFPGGMFTPDAATDATGWTEWVLPLRGGGWSVGPAHVRLNGGPAVSPNGWVFEAAPLRANSPDLNGDLAVDLTDIVLFTQDLGGAYAYRADFNWDQVVNLSDIVAFVYGLGATCP
jgi:hypothetical protein